MPSPASPPRSRFFVVLGDTVVVSADAFTDTLTTVTYDGFRGKKKFGFSVDMAMQDFQVRQGVKLTQVYSSFTSGGGNHGDLILRGLITGTKYNAPKALAGTQWFVFEDPPSHVYFAQRNTFTVHLDTVLTDASQAAGEAQGDAVTRVAKYLTDHHYSM